MSLGSLPKIVKRPAKRVGRGIGSGKGGHTATRGNKGQKSREKVKLTFEGTKVKKSLIKRLPKLRGKGVFKPLKRAETISLGDLAKWPAKTPVTAENMVKQGYSRSLLVKIVASGEVSEALTVKVPTTRKAAEKIRNAGGTIES